MKRLTLAVFLLAVGAMGAAYAWARLRVELRTESGPLDPPVVIRSAEAHVVTPRMLAAAGQMTEQPAPSFRAEATDGKTYTLQDLAKEGPLVLIFIKDGCPCSRSAEPFYNRLHNAYGAHVRFFGVIDGNVDVGTRWAKQNRVPFPILIDPDLKIVDQYKAENSAYLAIIARGGSIEKYWPGYSAGMLTEASERLARLTGVDVRQIDVTEAPEELYTGCPY